MSAVRVRELAPPARLRPFVEAFWLAEADRPVWHRVVPDGCVDLVFRFERGPDGAPGGGELLVAGPDRRARPAAFGPTNGYVGARFRPGVARRCLGLEPADLVDRGLVPAAVSARLGACGRRLGDCRTRQALLAATAAAVAALASEGEARLPPARVSAAVERLRAGRRVAEVARLAGVTQRTLHREIVAWTGLAPAMLIRVLRFRRACRALRRGGRTLADLAAATGYADQAHMARDFRAFAGVPPSAF